MTEYIERNKARNHLVTRLIETANNNVGYQCDSGTVFQDAADRLRLCWMDEIPTADVRPVVRGRWKDAMQSCHDSPHVKCSVCGEYYWQYFKKFNFCPNCGADMRGDDDGT